MEGRMEKEDKVRKTGRKGRKKSMEDVKRRE